MSRKQVAIAGLMLLMPAAAIAEPEIAIRDGIALMSLQTTPDMAGALDDRPPIAFIEDLPDNAEITIISPDGRRRTATLGQPIYDGDIIVASNGTAKISAINDKSITLVSGDSKVFNENDFPIEDAGGGFVGFLRKIFEYTADHIGLEKVPENEPIDYGPVGSLGIRG